MTGDERRAPAGRVDEHLEPEVVADLLEGLLDDGDAQRAVAHVERCERCRALRDDLAALPQLLRSLPDPGPVPDDLVARIDAALLEAKLETEVEAGVETGVETGLATGRAAPPRGEDTGSVHELDARRTPAGARRWGGRPARRRGRLLLAAAAAAAVVGVGAVTVPLLQQDGSGGDAATSAAGGATAPEEAGDAAGGGDPDGAVTELLASGRDYSPDALAAEVVPVAEPLAAAAGSAGTGPAGEEDSAAALGQPEGEAVPEAESDGAAGAAPAPEEGPGRLGAEELARSAAGPGAPAPGDVPAELRPLLEPERLAACLRYVLGGRPAQGVTVDLATYAGEPAALVLVPAAEAPGTVDVTVVRPSCGEPDPATDPFVVTARVVP